MQKLSSAILEENLHNNFVHFWQICFCSNLKLSKFLTILHKFDEWPNANGQLNFGKKPKYILFNFISSFGHDTTPLALLIVVNGQCDQKNIAKCL